VRPSGLICLTGCQRDKGGPERRSIEWAISGREGVLETSETRRGGLEFRVWEGWEER